MVSSVTVGRAGMPTDWKIDVGALLSRIPSPGPVMYYNVFVVDPAELVPCHAMIKAFGQPAYISREPMPTCWVFAQPSDDGWILPQSVHRERRTSQYHAEFEEVV